MHRDREGKRFWIVPLGRDELRLDLDYPWYDPSARRVDPAEGWAILEPLIQAGVSGVGGEQSWLRAVLLEAHAELAGGSFGVSSRDDHVATLTRALAGAVDSGRLVVTLRRPRLPDAPLGDRTPRDEDVLGPDSTPEPETTWVRVVLVDQDGAPVPGHRYRVVAPGGAVYDGLLDSHGAVTIRGLKPGSCQISCPYVEPHPARKHTVQPGEHLSGIAHAYGFDDFAAVWNHSDNGDLRSARADAHVLQPGDVVTIPPIDDVPAHKPTGAKHVFTIQRSPLRLRIKLLDFVGRPVSGASVTLGGQALTTGGDGVVDDVVDKDAAGQPLDAGGGAGAALSLGELNPVDDGVDGGWAARLYNLGFLWDPTVDDDDDEMIVALEDFQAHAGLAVTGRLDDATKAQVLRAHGA